MIEPEISFPIRCPICRKEVMAAFRISVVADALTSGDIRLYADCHVTSWDATESELERIRQFLDSAWSIELQEACEELSIESLSGADDEFFFPGLIEELDADEGGRTKAP